MSDTATKARGRPPKDKIKAKNQKPKNAKIPEVPAIIEKAPPILQRNLTEKEIIEAFDVMGITAKLSDKQKSLFIAIAREFQLNPLRREIHAVRMGGDEDSESSGVPVPVVGYEVYIDRAEATGRLEYWYPEESGEIDYADWKKSTYKVTLVIKRKDWPREFRWTVRYLEAVGLKYNSTKGTRYPNSMWQKRGHFMTQKCAIGQSFRLVFRDILRGMPYVDAEIEDAINGEAEDKEELGELKPPQALNAEIPAVEPGIQIVQDVYKEIMDLLNQKEKSKEGPTVAIFSNQEKTSWKEKADEARKNPEALEGILIQLGETAGLRKEKIREDL